MKKEKNFIKKYWEQLENKKKFTRELKKIHKINSKLFFEKIKSKDRVFIKKMIFNLYSGDFYVIKNVISKKYLEELKLKLVNYSQKTDSSFHKMYENCPNFWRRHAGDLVKKYSIIAVKDAYYFFRWKRQSK